MIPVQPGNLGTIERRCEDGDDVSLTGNVVDIRLVIRIRKPKRSNKPIFVENNRFVDSTIKLGLRKPKTVKKWTLWTDFPQICVLKLLPICTIFAKV